MCMINFIRSKINRKYIDLFYRVTVRIAKERRQVNRIEVKMVSSITKRSVDTFCSTPGLAGLKGTFCVPHLKLWRNFAFACCQRGAKIWISLFCKSAFSSTLHWIDSHEIGTHLKGADIKSRLKVAPHIYRDVSENTGLKKKLGSRLEIPCYAAFWQTLPLFHNPTAFAALRAAHKELKVLRFWEK